MSDAMNYNSYKYLQAIISPQVDIIDVEVRGKWIVATLSSGVHFMVINNLN